MEEYLYLGIIIFVILGVLIAFFCLWSYHQKQLALTQLTKMGFGAHEPLINEDDLNHFAPPEKELQWESPDSPQVANLPQPIEPEVRTTTSTNDLMNDLIAISVVAKPGFPFASYELLQAISTTGMQFGEMNIFHYYDITQHGKVKLFSLASATKPGEFDLDRMGEFSCVGLTLFTRLEEVPDAQEAFDLMLQTARQLADDLEGELRATPRQPWDDEIQQEYYNKVSLYQK